MPRTAFAAFLLAACFARTAGADHREFAFGVSYAHLFWDGSASDALEEHGGLRLEGRLSWLVGAPMTDRTPELRLGVGLGLTFYVSEQGGDVFEEDDVIFIRPDDWTQLSNIEPEVQFSLRQPIGGTLYLEPGVAGVFMLGNFRRGEEFWGFVDEDLDRWSPGAGGRLFLRAAYRRDEASFGVEGSYGYGWLHFGDDIGGDIQQGYLGIFYAQRY